MSTNGKEYKLAIRIAGIIDKSFTTSLAAANTSLKATLLSVDKDFTMLDKGFNKVAKMGQRCFSTIATAAGVATVAIGAATAASIAVGSGFEAQMSTVKAISGATAEKMVLLTEKARELAQTSVFSAKEVGNAMEYMGMAGWKTEQILAGIGGVLDLAAASGEDFSMVSDIVTDDLTAFNMTADETQRMVDVMAQAAMNSNTNVALMGETFKYAGTVAGALNYSIEDIAIATGLMASSAVKGSMAGTTLRNIMTRMAKPTKESAEAMEALGLSLEKDDGTMYSFYEIMEKLRESMKGLSATKKAYYAAELGGQRGMTGLLAIANASDEEFKKLTDAIYNAEGAAEKMAEIRLDNLAGDAQVFKDSLKDAGIEFYYQFNDQLRSGVQFGTDLVNSAKVNIPKYFQIISAEFPTLQRKFKKYGEPVFNGITGAGKWIVKNGKTILSILSGVGTAMAGYKVASSGVHFITALTKLGSMNPVTLGILGVVGAIGALTGAIVAYKQQEAEMVNNNLAEHFGNIALSMKDIQQVAEYIVNTESLAGVRAALETFEGVELVADELDEITKQLDKMNWKVLIGMELSEDEQGEYKTAINEYIQAAQNYVTESQYAVSLGLKIGLGNSAEGTEIASKVGLFYQDTYNEMVLLGEQLSEAVNEAFADNILDPEEVGTISEIQSKMAELQRTLATSEFDAQLSLLGNKYGGNLDAESFQNLIAAINEQAETSTKVFDDAYVKDREAIDAAHAAGEKYVTDKEYQEAIRLLDQQYLKDVGDLQTKGIDFILQTIMQQYGDELNPLMEQYRTLMDEAIHSYGDYDWENNYKESYADLFSWFDAIMGSDLDSETSGAINQLLEGLAPSMEQMEELRERYEEAGIDLSESMQKGFYNYNLLSTFANDMGLIGEEGSYLLGQELSKAGLWDEVYSEIFSNPGAVGNYLGQIGQGAIDAAATVSAENISAAADSVVKPAVEGLYAWSQETLDEYFSKGFTVNADVNMSFNPTKNMNFGNMAFSGINHRANGGLATRPELTWFAENGPEMAIPIDGSRNAISLWEKTGRLLGMNSVLDGVDLGGGSGPSIEYSPTLQFYGEAPSKDDLTDALRISQDEFDSLMDRYFKNRGRMAFG